MKHTIINQLNKTGIGNIFFTEPIRTICKLPFLTTILKSLISSVNRHIAEPKNEKLPTPETFRKLHVVIRDSKRLLKIGGTLFIYTINFFL